MPNDTLADGVVRASWPGETQRVELGPYNGARRTFLATCEIGERMGERFWQGPAPLVVAGL